MTRPFHASPVSTQPNHKHEWRVPAAVLFLAGLAVIAAVVFLLYAPWTPERRIEALLREARHLGDGSAGYRVRSFFYSLPGPLSGLADVFDVFNDPATLPALEAAQEDRDGDVRRNAAAAVRRLRR